MNRYILLAANTVVMFTAGTLFGMYLERNRKKKDSSDDTIEEEFKRGGLKTPTNKPKINVSENDERQLTAYHHMYRSGEGMTDLAETEHPTDDSPERDKFIEDREKNKNKPPRIISADAAADLPPYIDNKVLYLYNFDETVVDDEDNVINEPEELLGDCLDKYDFYDSGERIIFVMNYSLDTCYEIQKVDASWSDVNEEE